MTTRLFDTQPLLFEFDAKVLDISEDRYLLDQSAIFTGGGGQERDFGLVNGLPLSAVSEDERGQWITVPTLSASIGDILHCVVDKEHRLDLMQQHSGEHILSGLAHSLHGYDNVGFHLNNSFMTIDFNGPLTDAELTRLEDMANERIRAGARFRIFYPTREEAKAISYRSKKEVEGPLRLVEVSLGDECVDLCACCAPHFENAQAIGLIKIIHAEHYKGGMRLTLLAGQRAVRDYRNKAAMVDSFCNHYSTDEAHVLASWQADLARIESLKEKSNLLSDVLTKRLIEEYKNVTKPLFLYEELLDDVSRRHLVNALIASGVPAVCICEPKGSFMMAAPAGVKALVGAWNAATSARGGGSDSFASGKLPDGTDMNAKKEELSSLFSKLFQN